ncbi:hypothetical protein CAEBREN_24285 [Caenorhabditis brenneri]|uniref:RING-type domain-containing protein n=1 Tax=Caenorhabditis brenneri TaxID=135651 RepID=G0N3Q9_CAEBE|nr:hypothetical protein CAEBREN_24285 [Caenorhabditis brenneri]
MASLECKVCFEEYSEADGHIPRMLSCGHTICEDCAEKLLDDQWMIRCPLDRKMTCVSSGDVRDLSKNYTVLEVLEERSSSGGASFMTTSNQDEKEEENNDDEYFQAPCNENELHNSDYFCDKCEVFLCESCFNLVHAPKVLSGHTKTDISEMPLRTSVCAKHPFNSDSDCKEEDAEICHICYLEKNMPENYKNIISVMPSYRNQIIKAIKHTEKNTLVSLIVELVKINLNTLDGPSPGYQRLVQKIKDEIYAKETEALQTFEDSVDRLARENREEFLKTFPRFTSGMTFEKVVEHALKTDVFSINTELLEKTLRDYEGYVEEVKSKNRRPLDKMRLQLTPQMDLVVGQEDNE